MSVSNTKPEHTVAVVQAAPVAFDVERTLQKLADLTASAHAKAAELVLFPEAFVSAYPRGLDFGAVVGARTAEGREQYRLYWESAIDVPGPAVDRVGDGTESNRRNGRRRLWASAGIRGERHHYGAHSIRCPGEPTL